MKKVNDVILYLWVSKRLRKRLRANFVLGSSATVGGGANAAGGGFVLYPSKPNTNMMNSVYYK
jgi:hypothetical protein